MNYLKTWVILRETLQQEIEKAQRQQAEARTDALATHLQGRIETLQDVLTVMRRLETEE